MSKKLITAFYASVAGFCGQRFATEILIEGLNKHGWQVKEVRTPALDRITIKDKNKVNLLFNLIKIYFQLVIV